MANTPNLGLEKIDSGTKPYFEKYWANLDKIDANNPKHKFDATTAPTVNNDSTEGYSVGSRWVDVTNGNFYVCRSATEGAAVWKESATANIDSAIELKHAQDTDQYLDKGGANEVAVADVKDAVNKKHDHPIPDTTPIVKGSDDATKQVRIEADGLTTGTTRVLTMPDKDITPADKEEQAYTESPMIVSGGKVTTGTNAGTFKVEALTALLRTTDSPTGELKKVTKDLEDNISIPSADTTYFVSLNYNAGSPTISLSTSSPYEADKRNIPIGKVMKDSSGNVHYLSGGFRFQDGIKKSHQRAKELREIELESGSAIKYLATDKFTMETGVAYSGLNRFPLSAYSSDTTQFTMIYSDGADGWTEVDRNTIDCSHYDNGTGTLATIGNNRYGCHYVYKHVGDEHVYVVLGTGSYTLAEAVTNAVIPPEKPSHLDDFGCLIGCIIAPKNGGEFTKVIMITSQFFSGTEVANHANLSNLEYANSGHTGFAKSGVNDDITEMTALTQITRATGGTFNIATGSASGDDFTINTDKVVVEGDTGNIGIGTTSPDTKLQVNGGIRLGQSATGVDDDNQYVISSGGQLLISSNDSGADGIYSKLLLCTAGTERIDIDRAGNIEFNSGDVYFKKDTSNVGIGTTSPSSALHVRKDMNGYSYIMSDNLHAAGSGVGSGFANVENGGVKSYFRNERDGTGTQTLGVTAAVPLVFEINNTEVMRLRGNDVGIGTASPEHKLAINIDADGTLQDFEVADAIQGNITVSSGTVSYNAFCGSHYTQLKDGQKELPVGAVVISTGEIVPCEANIEETKEIKTEVSLKDAFEEVETEVDLIEEKEVDGKIQKVKKQIGEEFERYELQGEKVAEVKKPIYAKKIIKKKQLKANHSLDPKTGKIFKTEIIKKIVKQDVSNKEYFPYIDTTNKAGDKRVYGVWFDKMSDDAKGAAFGQDSKPVYLIAQVGLFKIRVTDTNGNIKVGDYLETSPRPMEAQRQTSRVREAGTIAKAMVNVDFSKVKVDPELGYKWKLIPCVF